MTADPDKDCTQCLVCCSKVGISTRNSICIFKDNDVTTITTSEKPLADVIAAVLEVDINEDSVHSRVICKHCFNLFNEVDELEARLIEIKMELSQSYTQTVKQLSNIKKSEEEYNDHDYADNGDSQHSLLEADMENEKEILLEENIEDDVQEMMQEDEQEIMQEDMQKDVEEDIEMDVKIDAQEQVEESLAESEVVVVEELNDFDNAVENKNVNSTDEKKKNEVNTNIQDLILKEEFGFTCLLCLEKGEKVTEDDKAIIAHMKLTHELRLYICDLCGQDFRKRTELSMHLDDHVSKEEGDFQCEICNRIFTNLRLFRIHKRVHYPHLKSWTCETCGKKYNSKNLLTEHMNTHTGARPYICHICKKDFASKYTYRAHIKTHEVRPRPFECSQCNKTFLSQQNLIQHERTHSGAKEYVCTHCGKAFGSSHNLEVHSIVHSGYKPYVCKLCSKAFARRAEIRDHERTHTGEKPYQCELCGATFSQRSNLQSHKRATHYNDKRYKCEICEKGFKRRRLLDYHIKAAHTGERPFKCDVCSATFVYPEHFKKHRRIHTGEKPYLCEVCGKAFNSRDNRNAHRFIHSDKKPYECLVCGMGFMRKPLLYAHMQNQGHINDTIVVNQPSILTMEDDQVIAIPDNDGELLMEETENEQLDDNGLYVTELKNHVIIQQERDQIYNGEESVVLSIPAEETVRDETDSLVVESQMNFTGNDTIECKAEIVDQVETVYTYNETVDGETVVVPTTQYQSGDKNVRLVQIRLPVEGENKNWLSLVQNT